MDNGALWFFKGPFLVLSPSVKGICVEHDAIVYMVCGVELGARIWGAVLGRGGGGNERACVAMSLTPFCGNIQGWDLASSSLYLFTCFTNQ